LLLNVLLPAGMMLFDRSLLGWSLAGLIPLGIWQLFSALVLGLFLKDNIRCLYMITAVSFCSLPISISFLSDWLPRRLFSFPLYELEMPFFVVMLSISVMAAILYYYYSLTSYTVGKKQMTL
ncbi:MAG: hypothetical protein KDD15_23745, partial [Lewinella sp.]|nr:hypothetical protein [Lewinella sp.]